MFKTLKTIFQKEKQTKYFAEFRINGKYRKIELSRMQPKNSKIQMDKYILTVESSRKVVTKDAIEIIYLCSYKHLKY